MPQKNPNRPPQSEPLGYLLTWTTYGTWLPGDERGWTKRGGGDQEPDEVREKYAERRLSHAIVVSLNRQQRQIVEETIRKHCEYRGWKLHAVSCRSNHVHVVVTASVPPKEVLKQFKAWTARCLNELVPRRKRWWTDRGSGRFLNCDDGLEKATIYVRESQDRKGLD